MTQLDRTWWTNGVLRSTTAQLIEALNQINAYPSRAEMHTWDAEWQREVICREAARRLELSITATSEATRSSSMPAVDKSSEASTDTTSSR